MAFSSLIETDATKCTYWGGGGVSPTLRNNRQSAPEILQTDIHDVDIVNQDTAIGRFDESEERKSERRFTRTGSASTKKNKSTKEASLKSRRSQNGH